MKTVFTNEEIAQIKANPNVLNCTDKTIKYTNEFKRYVLEQYNQGLSSKEIWKRAGFDISRWNNNYCKDAIKTWKDSIKQNEMKSRLGIVDRKRPGRPKMKGKTDKDRIEYLELEIKYLKAENDFLAKLRARRME